MQYKLIESKEDRSKYDVFETATDQVIKSYAGDKFSEARKFMRHLNLGGGFDGWTPTFFLRDLSNTTIITV